MERDILPRGELVGGTYRVDGPLGRGGMGAVLRATDLRAGRQVAIKVLLEGGAARAARFAREAELVARLDSVPGVVRVHARGEHRGLPWFAMELVEGEDLARRLVRGPLPVREALELVERLARTLAECHALGVIHRDLKPANILLGPAGPRVVDFGLARAGVGEAGEEGERFTRTGEVVGTPAFMAPEQLDPRAQVDARADVYALGAVLYQALTGEPVVDATTLPDLAAQLLDGPEPPSRRVPGLPLDVDAVVMTALVQNPAGRYPTAAALADDLARLRGGSRVSAVAPAALARRRLARRTALVALVALALGLGVGGATSLLGARRSQEREADAAALEAHRAWEVAALGSWTLGLGPGAPPPADDVARRASDLHALAARAQERDGAVDPLGRAASAAASRLDDVGRLLARAAGPPSREPFGRVVDAALARAAGDLTSAASLADQALGKEPLAVTLRARLWSDVLSGGEAAEWRALGAWLAGLDRRRSGETGPEGDALAGAERTVRAAALGALGPAVARRLQAAPDEPDAARGLEELVGAARSVLALDAAGLVAAVGSAKVAALEASAAAWVARAGGAVGFDALPVVKRLCAVAALEPRVLVGPALRAAQAELLRPTLEAWSAAAGDRRRELGRAAAQLDALLVHDVDARRPPPPALREVSLELMLEGPPTIERAAELLLLVRCNETFDPLGPAKRLGAEGCRAIQVAWPRSRGAHLLDLLLALELEPARQAGDPRLAELQAALAGDALGPGTLDISDRVVAEAHLLLGRQQSGLFGAAHDPALREAALASAASAKELSSDPWVWRSAYEIELPMIRARSVAEGWRALEAAAAHFEAGLARAAAARTEGHTDAVCLARVLNLAARFMPPANEPGGRVPEGDRPRLLGWARRSMAHVNARPDAGNDEVMFAHHLLLGALRHMGTPEALAEAEALGRAAPPRVRTLEWAVEWALVAHARGDRDEALARLAEARRTTPPESDSRQLLPGLEKFLQRR